MLIFISEEMVFVDSNVWIGYFNSNDKHHPKSFNIINAIKENQEIKVIYVTSGIVHEVVNHLFKIRGEDFARRTLSIILSLPKLQILFLTDILWEKTIENFNIYKMGLTDAQIVSAMSVTEDNSIYSFDGHFDQVKWIRRVF